MPVSENHPSWRGILVADPGGTLGLWFCCSQAGESLWLDELHTSWVVAMGCRRFPPARGAGNQSPLYFYLEWGVVQLAGQHEWTLRWLSLAAGTGLILAVGRTCMALERQLCVWPVGGAAGGSRS